MRNTPPESEVPSPNPAPPFPPPKILDQITRDFLPPEPNRPVQPAPPPPPPAPAPAPPLTRPAAETVASKPAPAEPPLERKNGLLAGAVLVLIVLTVAAVLAFTLFRPQVKRWLQSKPALQSLGFPSNTVSPADLKPLKPRLSFPPPPESQYSSEALPASQADLVTQLSRSLAADLAAGQRGLRPLLGKAALSTIEPKFGLTDDDLRGLADPEKQVLAIYRDAFTELGRSLGTTGNRQADLQILNAQQDRLAKKLEDRKTLEIAKLTLCRRVAGFGKYEPYLGNEFTAGSLPLILVYAELAHTKPLSQTDGRFLITLTVEFTLLDAANGGEIWKQEAEPLTDESASRKRDFHIAQDLRLPGTTAPGKYRLRVKITDQSNGAAAEAGVPLTISGR